MSTDVQGIFRKNTTFDSALLEACEKDGMGWWGQWRVSRALRRLSDSERQKLEAQCTKLLTDTGLVMGDDDIVGGCYVGDWGDGTIIQILIDALPKILEFIKALLPLFFMFATLLVCCGLLAGTASAQCSGGVCRPAVLPRTVERARTVVVDKQPVRNVVIKRSVTAERKRPLVNWLRRR
jgi:hypothetical protein